MFCNKCGNSLADDAKFCTECGANVEQEEIVVNAPDADTSQEPEKTEPKAEEAAVELSSDVEAETVSEDNNVLEEAFPDPETAPESAADKPNIFSSDEVPEITDNSLAAAPLPDGPLIVEQNEAAQQKPEAPKKLSAGRFVGASVISVFLIVFLLIFNIILSAAIGLNSKSLPKAVRAIRLENLLDTKINSDETLNDYIYKNLDGKFIRSSNAEKKDVRNLLLRLNITEYAAEHLKDYMAYLIDGTQTKDPSLTSDDIIDYLKKNSDVFEEELSFYMKDSDYKEISDSLDEMNVDDKLSLENWSDTIGFNLSNVHFLFSFITIGIVFAFVLVLYIWIAIVLDKRGRHIMGYFGNATLTAGLVTFIPAAAFAVVAAAAALYTGNTIVFVCAYLLFPFVCCALIIGAVEILAAIIFKKVKKHLKRKELKINGGF